MPVKKHLHKAIVAAAFGVSLLGGAVVFADHRDDLTNRDVTETERSHFRSSGLSGGFYENTYKADDWFYDFYEVPGDRTDPRFTDQARLRRPGAADWTERDRWADAAHPADSRREFQRRSAVETAYSRYYDEPWFYEPRDPAYGAPKTPLPRLMTVRIAGTPTRTSSARPPLMSTWRWLWSSVMR